MGKFNEKGLQQKKAFKAEMKKKRSDMKHELKAKRARLAIGNLPFKATEENIKEHFEKYGEVENVNILKKPDGKLVGCAFVQFKLVQKAAKARFHLNNQPFLGRNISVDFSLPKDKYNKEKKKKLKEEMKIKEENDVSIVKVEDVKEESDDDKGKTELTESDKSDDSDSDSDDASEKPDIDQEIEEPKRPRVISNDINEGKTVFIKNIPYSATNEDLRECFLQFGQLYYALVCVDKLTEHSRGTGFVKFRNKEDADKCLEAGTELKLMGQILDCHIAIGRQDSEKNKTKPIKDNRNLYLVKEGVVLAGTKAAEGVSASDMAKRLQLEQYKSQILRNLNMEVSRNRIIFHNIPPTFNDEKLRMLVKKHSNPEAVIKEVRIMRDRRDVDTEGIGKSKEYGFISFTRHEDALQTLRSLNNNPNVFSEHKRPIVAFSIENKAILKGKQKRLQVSQQRNPNFRNEKSTEGDQPENKKTEPRKYGKRKRLPVSQQKNPNNHNEKSTEGDQPENKKTEASKYGAKNGRHNRFIKNTGHKTDGQNTEFSGVTAKPGVIKNRSRYNLKTQAILHQENIKKSKKQQKQKQTFQQKKSEFTKQGKQKINKKVTTSDSFSQMVNQYKQNLIAAPVSKKMKWYE